MNTPRVFMYVQHLMGIGHYQRAAAIANALAACGSEVVLASGGPPVEPRIVEGVTLVQLPSAHAADATFRTILGETGEPIGDAWREARKAALEAAFDAADPDALVTELFPFGRRKFAFELVPLLERVRRRRRHTLVLASVRDVLVAPGDPRRLDECLERVRRFYDAVLVHSDPSFIRLEDSLPEVASVADRLVYTGYVALEPSCQPPRGEGTGEVIVSAGGGAVGGRLLETALAARPLSRSTETWRLLVGARVADPDLKDLRSRGGPGLIIERARPDFPALLHRAALSVSQGGYNTTVDILRAGIRSIVVPFTDHGETEQADRATRLMETGRMRMIMPEELNPAGLAQAVDTALSAPAPSGFEVDLGGAARSAELILDRAEWRAA